jgi:hypothetical protein
MLIELKFKHKISGSEIVFYSSHVLQLFTVVFGIFCVATVSAILYMIYSLNGEINMSSVCLCAISFLIFPVLFLAGNRQIIFGKRDETVYKSYGLGRKKVARFSDIDRIRYVDGDNCYKIFLKSDPYGKGIKITPPIEGKALAKFETEILPPLEQMLALENSEMQVKAVVRPENLKYYTRNNHIFKVKNNFYTIWYSFVALLAVSFFVWACVTGRQPEFRFIPVPIFLASVYMGSRRSFFDVERRTFNTSVFFFVRKNYDLSQFVNFRTVRHSVNGMYDHTSVELVFEDKNGKQRSIKLRDFRKTRKIESFIDETKAIMNNFADIKAGRLQEIGI